MSWIADTFATTMGHYVSLILDFVDVFTLELQKETELETTQDRNRNVHICSPLVERRAFRPRPLFVCLL